LFLVFGLQIKEIPFLLAIFFIIATHEKYNRAKKDIAESHSTNYNPRSEIENSQIMGSAKL